MEEWEQRKTANYRVVEMLLPFSSSSEMPLFKYLNSENSEKVSSIRLQACLLETC